MPHVIVKLWPGKTEEQKTQLADAIASNLVTIMGSSDASISVAIEEVDSSNWAEQVYRPDILDNAHHLYKKPGYNV